MAGSPPLRLTLGPPPISSKPRRDEFIFPSSSQKVLLASQTKIGPNPFVTMWIPAYGGMRAGTVCCVIAEMTRWGSRVRFSANDEDDHIGRSRSKIATAFLNTPREEAGDVLLMVDNDIQWQAGDLAYIARKAVEKTAIVGGMYPKRAFGQGIPYRWKETGEFKIGDDVLVEADFVSSGFMAIPRSILEAIKSRVEWIVEGQNAGGWFGFFLPHVHTTTFGREFLSEDWELCQTAVEAGFKIYLAMKPRLEHEGWYKYRLVDAHLQLPVLENLVFHIKDDVVEPQKKETQTAAHMLSPDGTVRVA